MPVTAQEKGWYWHLTHLVHLSKSHQQKEGVTDRLDSPKLRPHFQWKDLKFTLPPLPKNTSRTPSISPHKAQLRCPAPKAHWLHWGWEPISLLPEPSYPSHCLPRMLYLNNNSFSEWPGQEAFVKRSTQITQELAEHCWNHSSAHPFSPSCLGTIAAAWNNIIQLVKKKNWPKKFYNLFILSAL